MSLLTKNMKTLIQEVKDETLKREKLRAYELVLETGVMDRVERGSEQDLDREEFGRLLAKVGISGDELLIDRVFWVFDEDDSGRIGFRELGIGLEMLNTNSYEDKLDTFFYLCDEDNSNTIDKKEFYNLLRITLATSYEERGRIKDLVN
jgi:Ca2+-binding EF-hand superfamily protein